MRQNISPLQAMLMHHIIYAVSGKRPPPRAHGGGGGLGPIPLGTDERKRRAAQRAKARNARDWAKADQAYARMHPDEPTPGFKRRYIN